ncbi:MAG: hypothetical protein WC796_02495 [Candidatus Pacearchaeota archaeon]|jgi:hypothetical protein
MLTLHYIERVGRLNWQTGYVPGRHQSSAETELMALKDLSASVREPDRYAGLRITSRFEHVEDPVAGRVRIVPTSRN